MSDDALAVEFLGEEYAVSPGDSFAFGRSADLSIDENNHLHRRLGQFDFADGMWWLHNIGSALTIEVIDRNSPSRLTLAPGASTALVFEEACLRFQAGPSQYEVNVDVPLLRPTVEATETTDGVPTVTGSQLTFTADQFLCILSLAEPRLRDRASVDIPTNKAAAARLGWKITKFNRKLDNVCNKVGNAGVPGLHGGAGALATKRRERLVDYALATSVVAPADLARLDDVE